MAALLPILMSILGKFLTTAAIENLLVWALESLAAATESPVDDDLVRVVKKALGKPVDPKEEEGVG